MTSYFAMHKQVKFENPVSIAQFPAVYYHERCYRELAPPADLLMGYKKGRITKEIYTREYERRVLRKLTPRIVADELGEDAVLLCFEIPGEFCHRHIVAKWLNAAGYRVVEYDPRSAVGGWFSQ